MRDVLLALPAAIVTTGLALASGAEMAGMHALTMGAPRSVSEAIAMRDHASAARLLEAGAEANAIELVRAGILSASPVLATPLETAVIVDAGAVFDYLLSRGAVRADNLACLAADVGARTVLPYLSPGRCRPGEALQKVLDRP